MFKPRTEALYKNRDLVRSALTLPQRPKETSYSRSFMTDEAAETDGIDRAIGMHPKPILDAPIGRIYGLRMTAE